MHVCMSTDTHMCLCVCENGSLSFGRWHTGARGIHADDRTQLHMYSRCVELRQTGTALATSAVAGALFKLYEYVNDRVKVCLEGCVELGEGSSPLSPHTSRSPSSDWPSVSRSLQSPGPPPLLLLWLSPSQGCWPPCLLAGRALEQAISPIRVSHHGHPISGIKSSSIKIVFSSGR
ncbi:unnamed protein product [Protopolystoma xenopodis]|uniref:Uncharacterized protein n=1 Tax=Protopolystoma xenopodis TaxID=117903 RepID=A0A448WZ22_9PLAT|nr:unnamed protein product [Protopolystoma xenopodis]